jgi:hypothetical protein
MDRPYISNTSMPYSYVMLPLQNKGLGEKWGIKKTSSAKRKKPDCP